MRRYVRDRDLRAKLTPHYRPGCKRILISSDFYQAVADPRTELITEGVARVTGHSIVTVDGTERDVDAIVLATGFHVDGFVPLCRHQGRPRRRSGRPMEPRRGGGPSRHHRCRCAQPFLPARAQHRAGTQLGGLHDRIADPLRRFGDRCGGQGRKLRRLHPHAPPRTRSTRSCSTTFRGRCGTPAGAVAGTSTNTVSTGRCGRGWLPSTGWPPGGSSLRSTGSSASATTRRHNMSASEPLSHPTGSVCRAGSGDHSPGARRAK